MSQCSKVTSMTHQAHMEMTKEVYSYLEQDQLQLPQFITFVFRFLSCRSSTVSCLVVQATVQEQFLASPSSSNLALYPFNPASVLLIQLYHLNVPHICPFSVLHHSSPSHQHSPGNCPTATFLPPLASPPHSKEVSFLHACNCKITQWSVLTSFPLFMATWKQRRKKRGQGPMILSKAIPQ